MVKYKVNVKFKEDGKTLNETITDVLTIELENIIIRICNNFKTDVPFRHTHYSQDERSMH